MRSAHVFCKKLAAKKSTFSSNLFHTPKHFSSRPTDFNEVYKSYVAFKTSSRYVKEIEEPNVRRLLQGEIKGKSVLDVGCGFGYHSRLLAEMHPRRHVALDISSDFLSVAAKTLEKFKRPDYTPIEVVCQDATTLDYSEEFDLVLAMHSVSFIEPHKFKSFWERIYKALKPGGKLIGFNNHRDLNLTFPKALGKEFGAVMVHSPDVQIGDQAEIWFYNPEGEFLMKAVDFWYPKEVYQEAAEEVGFHYEWSHPTHSDCPQPADPAEDPAKLSFYFVATKSK